MIRLLGFILVLNSVILSLQAQDVKVQGGFVSDSLKIGEETAFYLSARYKSNLNALFPDSASGFAPFEFQRKKYFPTQTENGISFDSTVYYLTTFEVDRVQYLDLPVYIVQPQDCTEFRTSRDSILITQLVAQVPDSVSVDKLPLKETTAYQLVFFELNTWIIVISVVVLIIIAVLIWLFFGKRISRYFTTRRLQRNHSKFIESYSQFLRQLQSAFSRETAEDALRTWKKYMEQLETVPYTKLTTRETFALIHDENLAQDLRQVDKSIYGHDTSVVTPLENLKVYADQHFSQKLNQLKHGATK
jgi:hypothetical protein